MCISQSVGLNAPNQNDDVTLIQALLNLNLTLLPGVPFLTEDGVLGPHSQAIIQQFQSLVATPGTASGVIDPGGATLAALRAAVSGQFGSNLLHVLMPLSSEEQAEAFAAPLVASMNANQINTALRQAHFLAQLGHESGSLRYTAELASGAAYGGRVHGSRSDSSLGDGPAFQKAGRADPDHRPDQLQPTDSLTTGGQRLHHRPSNPKFCWPPIPTSQPTGSRLWFWAMRQLNEPRRLTILISSQLRSGSMAAPMALTTAPAAWNFKECLLIP